MPGTMQGTPALRTRPPRTPLSLLSLRRRDRGFRWPPHALQLAVELADCLEGLDALVFDVRDVAEGDEVRAAGGVAAVVGKHGAAGGVQGEDAGCARFQT